MPKHCNEQRGLSEIKPYVPGKPMEELRREYGVTDVIKLASNENPLGASPKALVAMKAVLSETSHYPDGQSCELRQALAVHLGVAFEQVTVGNGADGLIMQTELAYLNDGDEVIVSRSSFPVYDIYAHVMRATLTKVPVKDYRLDLTAMADAITDQTKLIFVCNPNNPTGTIVTSGEVETFMQHVPDRVLVIFDEAYVELVDSTEFPDSLRYVRDGQNNVMVLRTFSKVYGLAGIRIGYAVAEAETLAPLFKVKEPFAVNRLAQAAGIAALKDDGFLKRTVATNSAGREQLYRGFERLKLQSIESHTNFVLVRIGSHSLSVQQRLLEYGIIVRPCTAYDLPDFLRISVGDTAQNARLLSALEETMHELEEDDFDKTQSQGRTLRWR
jgi:histidinol-phosphate aminotransferase